MRPRAAVVDGDPSSLDADQLGDPDDAEAALLRCLVGPKRGQCRRRTGHTVDAANHK